MPILACNIICGARNMNKLVLGFIVIMLGNTLSAENFVLKSKKKGPSSTTLKESCATICTAVFERIPGVLSSISEAHSLMFHLGTDLLEGEKNSFFAKASKEQLQEFQAELAALDREIEASISKINQRITHIKTLEKRLIG